MFKKDKNMIHIINKNLYKKLLHKIEQIYTNILIILIQRIHLSYIKKKKKKKWNCIKECKITSTFCSPFTLNQYLNKITDWKHVGIILGCREVVNLERILRKKFKN